MGRSHTALAALVGILLGACAGGAASPSTTQAPTPSPTTQPGPVATRPGSATSRPPSTSTTLQPDGATRIQQVDPATLEPVEGSWELPGHLSHEHVVLPDGRLVLFTWEGDTWHKGWVSLVDLERGERDTLPSPFTSGVRTLGYSPALEQVVLLSDLPGMQLGLFDPATGEFQRDILDIDTEADIAVHEAVLFDGGTKVAFYVVPGYLEDEIYEPPFLRVADIEIREVGDPIALDGVVHGLVELPPGEVRNESWPYGEAEPGIAFDAVDGRVFVAHADGKGITVADLHSATVEQVDLGPKPSFWAKALSWLVPPAEAKGSEPSVSMSAWLNHDGGRLFVTGSVSDGWRNPDTREFHATTTPLGLTVIDTDTLEVVKTLDLPVSYGVSTEDSVAVVGTRSDLVFCDEVCQPGNNEPETEGSAEHSGLHILDPLTLETRAHHRPGTNFYAVAITGDWLIAESFGDDGDIYESIDLEAAVPAAQIPYSDTLYLATEAGLFEYRFHD